jgi:hypothetical protein
MAEGYRLFYDDHQNALANAVDNNVHGLTFKQVACALWPNLKPESAYARLKNCLNPEKDEKLDLSEIKLLCRVTGRYEPLYWLCDETDHARPAQRAPEDKQAELVRSFITHAEALEKIHRQITAGGGIAALASVSGGKS